MTSLQRLGLFTTWSLLSLFSGCGARTNLDSGRAGFPKPECETDADCAAKNHDLCTPVMCEQLPDGAGPLALWPTARCVKKAPKSCDDNDPCTIDTCEPKTGACVHTWATADRDGDGHYAPRPGYAPGAPGSCGDDCNDTNPNVYPGAPEICDGLDNDCDGIVDEGFAQYAPIGGDVLVSGDVPPAGPGGVAWSGTSYAASYTGTKNGFAVYVSTLAADGTVITPPGEEQITVDDADASGGPIVWIGDRYGLAWQDRRTGDYELYANVLDATGKKAHADTRLTFADGFSVNPSMIWNGTQFVIVWQDDRDTGIFNIFGQLADEDANPIGGNVNITNDSGGMGNESPQVAYGIKTLGVVWNVDDALHHVIQFQSWSVDLSTPMTGPVTLTDGSTEAVYPVVAWNKDRYIVAWYDKTAVPAAVYATAVGDDGTVLVPNTPVTSPGPFHSRYPFLYPLGDRVLLVYSDDRDQNDGYEIYTRVFSNDLTPMGAEQRVTDAPHDSLFPFLTFGANQSAGILFRDDRSGQQDIYFTRLGCQLTGP